MSRMPSFPLPLRSGLRLVPLLAALAAGGGAVMAEEVAKDPAKDPDVKARIALMQAFKAQTGRLSQMAAGQVPFDAAEVEKTIAALQDGAGQVGPVFRPRADDPVSEALPDIWANPGEFRQKTSRLTKAVEALAENGAAGDAATLGSALAPVMAACKDCHGRFKL